ncbi:hypothetical protein PENSPDRAFT_93953 [Peniophora sp. CONT]|nr:hypothetical protein PENSPDRAFT_93953 [Peniophora sp. CONT]
MKLPVLPVNNRTFQSEVQAPFLSRPPSFRAPVMTDEATLLLQYESFIKLQHVLMGIYLWEYVINLPFDYKVLTSKKKSTQRRVPWIKAIYLSCRFMGVAAIVSIVAGLDINGPINCQAWVTVSFTFSYIALCLASGLIAIRVLTIWAWNKFVTTIAIIGLGVQAWTLIHNIVEIRAIYVPTAGTCLTVNPHSGTPNVTATFVLDMLLLVLMLVGLWRMRDAGRFQLWRILLNQGLFWLTLATVAELPTVIFIFLNVNPVLDTIFYSPELICLIIGATRLYRSLAEYTQRVPPVVQAQNSGPLRFGAPPPPAKAAAIRVMVSSQTATADSTAVGFTSTRSEDNKDEYEMDERHSHDDMQFQQAKESEQSPV